MNKGEYIEVRYQIRPSLLLLGRQKYLAADLGFTAILSSIFFFARYPRSSLNVAQSKPVTCSEVYVSTISKYMSKISGTPPSPYKLGTKTSFLTTSQLYGTAYIYGTKHDIDNQVSAWGFRHRPKTTWALVHKRLQTGPAFLPSLPEFCFLLHWQASQTEISKRNSTKLCQTVDSKSRANNVP